MNLPPALATIKVESVLHPSDFSDNSVKALRFAFALAELFGAALHIAHVVKESTSAVSNELGRPVDFEERAREVATRLLHQHLEAHNLPSEGVIPAVLIGDPYAELIRYARDNEIGMIVMGTHGRRKITQLLMGSVAERVVRKAPCPVLTVP
jgi:nucleotide-binding universal stress UspA family protein